MNLSNANYRDQAASWRRKAAAPADDTAKVQELVDQGPELPITITAALAQKPDEQSARRSRLIRFLLDMARYQADHLQYRQMRGDEPTEPKVPRWIKPHLEDLAPLVHQLGKVLTEHSTVPEDQLRSLLGRRYF